MRWSTRIGTDRKLQILLVEVRRHGKHGEIGEDDEEPAGVLGKVATSVLMKVLYGARAARFDLLKVVQSLAGRVSRWTELCDQRLHRMMCYIWSTKDVTMKGYVGDKIALCAFTQMPALRLNPTASQRLARLRNLLALIQACPFKRDQLSKPARPTARPKQKSLLSTWPSPLGA